MQYHQFYNRMMNHHHSLSASSHGNMTERGAHATHQRKVSVSPDTNGQVDYSWPANSYDRFLFIVHKNLQVIPDLIPHLVSLITESRVAKLQIAGTELIIRIVNLVHNNLLIQSLNKEKASLLSSSSSSSTDEYTLPEISLEHLNLVIEWISHVHGMAFPQKQQEADTLLHLIRRKADDGETSQEGERVGVRPSFRHMNQRQARATQKAFVTNAIPALPGFLANCPLDTSIAAVPVIISLLGPNDDADLQISLLESVTSAFYEIIEHLFLPLVSWTPPVRSHRRSASTSKSSAGTGLSVVVPSLGNLENLSSSSSSSSESSESMSKSSADEFEAALVSGDELDQSVQIVTKRLCEFIAQSTTETVVLRKILEICTSLCFIYVDLRLLSQIIVAICERLRLENADELWEDLDVGDFAPFGPAEQEDRLDSEDSFDDLGDDQDRGTDGAGNSKASTSSFATPGIPFNELGEPDIPGMELAGNEQDSNSSMGSDWDDWDDDTEDLDTLVNEFGQFFTFLSQSFDSDPRNADARRLVESRIVEVGIQNCTFASFTDILCTNSSTISEEDNQLLKKLMWGFAKGN
eukprot:TRINITY_DN2822_c2_g1_i1.p1 TRINITY_DN2822_c2_g1~~TRINITY_DN2822_c2_g1_i1.p1  ORF type:complete len:667 (+),score=221.91 TRINITY_DN2822_c2_g1_i1:263-2002(+)